VNGPGVDIQRLALRVPGLDPDAARTLARLVARGLAPGMFRPAGTGTLDLLRVEVRPAAGEEADPELLARRIVADIRRALEEIT
jgi:hypothetical protein